MKRNSSRPSRERGSSEKNFRTKKNAYNSDKSNNRDFKKNDRSFNKDRREYNKSEKPAYNDRGDRDFRSNDRFSKSKKKFVDREQYYKKDRNQDGDKENRWNKEDKGGRDFKGKREDRREYNGNREDRRGSFNKKREWNSDRPYKKNYNSDDNREGGDRRRKSDRFSTELSRNKKRKMERYSENTPTNAFKKNVRRKLQKGSSTNSDEGYYQKVRLNRFIANAGICSRRDADELIRSGQISINDEVVTELGVRVKRSDKVTYNGKRLSVEKLRYFILNKPKNYITTLSDPQGRKTVMALVKDACSERIYPVGRLDRHTTGLLLFTNDGQLAKKLMHPSTNIRKVYRVELDKPFTEEDFEKLGEGITLEDGFIKPDDLAINKVDRTVIGIEIHEGRNRIVRRIFSQMGYNVEHLDRTLYAGLSKKNVPRGEFRELEEKEIRMLKHFTR